MHAPLIPSPNAFPQIVWMHRTQEDALRALADLDGNVYGPCTQTDARGAIRAVSAHSRTLPRQGWLVQAPGGWAPYTPRGLVSVPDLETAWFYWKLWLETWSTPPLSQLELAPPPTVRPEIFYMQGYGMGGARLPLPTFIPAV